MGLSWMMHAMKDFGVEKNGNFGWIVVAVAAVAGLYYYFRKRKRA